LYGVIKISRLKFRNLKIRCKKLNPLRKFVARKFNKNGEYCMIKFFAEAKNYNYEEFWCRVHMKQNLFDLTN
jgi:hypothetical protein